MATVRKRKWSSSGKERTTWAVDYIDSDGKRRQKSFAKKKEADEYLVTVQGELRKGTHTPDSISKTVAEASKLWIAEAEHDRLERSTIKAYQEHINLHINPFIGPVKLSKLTVPGVNKFIRDLKDNGRSDAMLRKARGSLVSMLNCAQQEGWVAQNVAINRRKKRNNSRHNKEIEIPTKGDIRTILDNAPERWRPLILTAIFTGMRASELRGLSWNDIDLDAGVLRVTQRADAWGHIGSPKSKAGRRTISLAPIVANTLREWKLQCARGDLNLVFPNNSGGVQDWAFFYSKKFKPMLIKCEIVDKDGKPRVTFHALRHFAASLFIEQGWHPKKVQDAMGHSSITVTYDTYGHLFPTPEDDQKAMAQIEARLLA